MLSFVGMIELLPKTLTAQYAGFFLYDGTSGSESFIAHRNILSEISFARNILSNSSLGSQVNRCQGYKER